MLVIKFKQNKIMNSKNMKTTFYLSPTSPQQIWLFAYFLQTFAFIKYTGVNVNLWVFLKHKLDHLLFYLKYTLDLLTYQY